MSDIKNKILSLSQEFKEDLIQIRRHLHQNPELSFQEYETSKFIKAKLDEWGIDYKSVADTGIIAEIKGSNSNDKLIVLRGDMDALPIKENTGLSFSSQNEGVMHACGHDVHTSCVLLAGRILNSMKDNFEGSIKLLFQPGEEKLPGGATKVIASGELNNPKPDLIIGQHVFPELEAGKVGFRPGLYMASADEIYIDVKGPGGHGAMPHKTVDVLRVASELIVLLKDTIDERSTNDIPTVLSFGKIEGKGATNVIPKLVHIEGTFRTMDEEWRVEVHQVLQDKTDSIAKKFNTEIELNILKGYPCLINNEKATETLKDLARNYLGNENVTDLELRMTSEDFAFYSQEYPSCFYRLGVRDKNKEITNVHTPEFFVDEQALITGSELMAFIAIESLKK